MKSELLSTLLCSHVPCLTSLKTLGNRQRVPPIQKREKNPLTLKNRKRSSGQGQVVPREIITQTQEARTLKETENWAWIIFQLINCWNGANSTSGPAFIKLQDWLTLTSYCLSPCLSNQTREPVSQQAVLSSAVPFHTYPSSSSRFPIQDLSASLLLKGTATHITSFPEIPEVNQTCTDLTYLGIAAAPALWSHQGALEMLPCGSAEGWGAAPEHQASTGQLRWAAHLCDSDSSKSLWPGGPNKKY